jgi:AcrR family transcriptional regulator
MERSGRLNGDEATSSSNPSYDAILAAAQDLFVEVGFPGTSMDAIARRAEVVRATIYNNFRDKDAILAKIVERYQQGYADIPGRLRDEADADASSFDLIEATIRAAFRWRVANASIRPLLDLAKALPTKSAWNESTEAADDEMRRWLRGILRSDARRGKLRAGINVQFGSVALWGMIDSTLSSWDVNASPASMRKAVRQLALLVWYAIYDITPDTVSAGASSKRVDGTLEVSRG